MNSKLNSKSCAGPAAPGWLQTINLSQDPYKFFISNGKKFGDTYKVKIAGMGDMVCFSSPSAVKEFIALPSAGMHNGNDPVRYLLNSQSIVFLEGDKHRKTRRSISRPLKGNAPRGYSPKFIQAAKQTTSKWKDGEKVNMYNQFQSITFDALIAATFGQLDTSATPSFFE